MKPQNDYGFPRWLQYLLSVMRPNWKENGLGNETAKAIALLDAFYDEEVEKMLTAVKEYLKTKKDAYIPFPGDLSACFPQAAVETFPRSRSKIHWALHEMKEWPVCPMCEENTPNVNDCPFCADMKAQPTQL